jgi:hypothetical protein
MVVIMQSPLLRQRYITQLCYLRGVGTGRDIRLYQLVAILGKQHTRKYEQKNVVILPKQPESLLQRHVVMRAA